MRGLILVELVGHVAEWLRRGLQILFVYDLTLIISLLINIFTFNKDCKYSPVHSCATDTIPSPQGKASWLRGNSLEEPSSISILNRQPKLQGVSLAPFGACLK